MLPHDLGERERQLGQTFPGERADFEHRPASRSHVGAHHVNQVPAIRQVDLVEHDAPRPVGEAAVRLEFSLDRVDVGHRVTFGLEHRAVHHMHEHRTALNVPQELQAQSLAGGGTRHQAWYVGHDKVASPARTTPRFGTKVVNG